jgi:hypothetical protein
VLLMLDHVEQLRVVVLYFDGYVMHKFT